MIELSGLDPDRDIDIEVVGRRPGEKLHEQLFNDYERASPTSAEKIVRAERSPLPREAVESMFDEIGLLVLEGDAAGLAAKVSELSVARRDALAARAPEAAPPAEERPGIRAGDGAAIDGEERPPIGVLHGSRSAGRMPPPSGTDAPSPLVHSPHS